MLSPHKLKGSVFSIGGDFSLPTREARKTLIDYAKPQKKTFKLSVDTLGIDKKVYVYDRATQSVILSTT